MGRNDEARWLIGILSILLTGRKDNGSWTGRKEFEVSDNNRNEDLCKKQYSTYKNCTGVRGGVASVLWMDIVYGQDNFEFQKVCGDEFLLEFAGLDSEAEAWAFGWKIGQILQGYGGRTPLLIDLSLAAGWGQFLLLEKAEVAGCPAESGRRVAFTCATGGKRQQRWNPPWPLVSGDCGM